MGTFRSMSKVAKSISTIGYEGRSINDLLDALEQEDIQRLVDVRELPLSRKKGFSKKQLSEKLQAKGIQYVHLRALGNPKENRDRYRSGDIEGGARIYRQYLRNGSHSELISLAKSLDEAKSCLLCFERDHTTCHRDVIVDDLTDELGELEVKHL